MNKDLMELSIENLQIIKINFKNERRSRKKKLNDMPPG
jgi:hypothetical protein